MYNMNTGGEEMVIYADVLVSVNILVTYITLVATRVVCKVPTNKYFVALSSFCGGVFSLVIFFDGGAVFSVFYKIITALIIVAIAFLPKNIRTYLKCCVLFFGVTLLFGGAMLALCLVEPSNILYVNGTVYFDISLSYLLGSVVSIYGIFLGASYVLEKRAFKNELFRVRVEFRKTKTEFFGFSDTGNVMSDAVTGRAVILAELSAVKPLLSPEEAEFFGSGDFSLVPQSLSGKIRIIPCSTATGDGILKAFLPDRVDIFSDKTDVKNAFCLVAVTSKKLSTGEYEAIINSRILMKESAYEK